MPGVFLNYRVGDGEFCAFLIDQQLSALVQPHNVFRASRSIRPGTDFVSEINDVLSHCDLMVAIIGPHWLTDCGGRRRIDDEDDWVRREIAAAIRRRIPVVPVFFGDVDLLRENDLPDDIRPLARYQYERVHHRSVERDLAGLTKALLERIPELATPRRQTAAPGETERDDRQHLILSLDFEGPGGRSDLAKLECRDQAYRAVRRAFQEAEIDLGLCTIQDRDADGALILVSPEVPKARVLGVWIEQFYREWRARDVPRVRIGVHSGQVRTDTGAVACADLELANRLGRSGPAARLAEAAHGARVVVVVSDRIYESVVRHGGRFLDPDSYGRMELSLDEPAWAYVPGWSHLPTVGAGTGPRPEPAEPTEPARSGGPHLPATGDGRQLITFHGAGAVIEKADTGGGDFVIGTNYGSGGA